MRRTHSNSGWWIGGLLGVAIATVVSIGLFMHEAYSAPLTTLRSQHSVEANGDEFLNGSQKINSIRNFTDVLTSLRSVLSSGDLRDADLVAQSFGINESLVEGVYSAANSAVVYDESIYYKGADFEFRYSKTDFNKTKSDINVFVSEAKVMLANFKNNLCFNKDDATRALGLSFHLNNVPTTDSAVNIYTAVITSEHNTITIDLLLGQNCIAAVYLTQT